MKPASRCRASWCACMRIRSRRASVSSCRRATAQTDDRGQYRVWGLNPGEYYVSAVAPNIVIGPTGWDAAASPRPGGGPGGIGRGGDQFTRLRHPTSARRPPVAERAAWSGSTLADADGDAQATAYAPTYYPGVPSAREARPVTVGPRIRSARHRLRLAAGAHRDGRRDASRTRTAPRHRRQRQPGARRSGGRPRRSAWRATTVRAFRATARSRSATCRPGRYILRARASPAAEAAAESAAASGPRRRGRTTRGGATPATPGHAAVRGAAAEHQRRSSTISASCSLPGATITGSVTLQLSGATRRPDLIRSGSARPADPAIGQEPNARVDTVGQLYARRRPGRPALVPRAAAARTVAEERCTMNGRDVTDAARTFSRANASPASTVVLTDRSPRSNGTIADERGAPVTDYTVLAFPEDSALVDGRMSRHIMTARPDQNGQVPDPRAARRALLPRRRSIRRTGRVVRARLPRTAPRRRRPSDPRRGRNRRRRISGSRPPVSGGLRPDLRTSPTSQTNCRTLIARRRRPRRLAAFAARASIRSTTAHAVARPADHSGRVQPRLGPDEHASASDSGTGTGASVSVMRRDVLAPACRGSTSMSRRPSAARRGRSRRSAASGSPAGPRGATASTDASAIRCQRSTRCAAHQRRHRRLRSPGDDRLNRGDAQHHRVADDVVHLVGLEDGLRERERDMRLRRRLDARDQLHPHVAARGRHDAREELAAAAVEHRRRCRRRRAAARASGARLRPSAR